MIDPVKIKFNQLVWHDQPYVHPQLGTREQRDFFDRTAAKERLDSLRTGTQKLMIIAGERRAGKTSLLRLFMHKLRTDPSCQFITILIKHVDSLNELMQEIWEGILFELNEDLPVADPFDASPTMSEFLDALRHLLNLSPCKVVVLGIDEFDSLIIEAPIHEKVPILGLIRALVECPDLPVKLLLTVVRVSQIPGAHALPLFSESLPVNLPPFEKGDLAEMVLELLEDEAKHVTTKLLDDLYDISGGWPYFAKLLLVHMAKSPPGDGWLAEATCSALNDDLVKGAITHIYTYHFDDHEKKVVLLMAQRGGRVSVEDASLLDASLQTAAGELVNRHFISRDTAGNYFFRIGFWKAWFCAWERLDDEVANRL